MKNLGEVLDTFYGKKILVIGDVMLDKYTIGNAKRISPEAPIPVIIVEEESYKAGGAGNVALNAANLSHNDKVYLFGFIGEDNYGNVLKKILEDKGIKCYFEKNNLTTMKERVIGRSGQKQQIVRIDREETSPKKFNKSLDNLLEIAKEADRIIISDYAKGTITSNLMNALSLYKKKIIVDPKPTNKDFKTLYNEAFLITPNKSEALIMSNRDDVKEAGYFLRDEFKSNILVTSGKDGMILFPINSDMIEIKTTPEESFEETGAGDTAIATITLALYDDSIDSIVNAAKLGNYAAGITVKHIGTYAPTFQELKEKILSFKK